MIPAASLVHVAYVDEDGREWVHLAPQDADEDVSHYPRIGPPAVAAALEAEGWPRDAANRVQAGLVADGILTAADIKRPEVSAKVDGIIRRAARAAVQTVLDTYIVQSA